MKTEELKQIIEIRGILIECAQKYLKELRDPNITGTAMVKQAEVGPYIGNAIAKIDSILEGSGVQFSE
jgi:hypothetical protein